MKNKLLMGLIGIGLLLPLGVKAETLDSVAEGSNTSSATVTVGEVETPIYNVTIDWSDFKFNWKYNNTTNQFEWQNATTVDIIPLTAYGDFDETIFNSEKDNICTDSTCTTKISEDTTYAEISSNLEQYYYNTGVEQTTNHFHIGDHSTAASVVPSVKWTSSTGYEYVVGQFQYESYVQKCTVLESDDEISMAIDAGFEMYSDSNCTTEIPTSTIEDYQDEVYYLAITTDFVELGTEEIPENGRLDESGIEGGPCFYNLKVNLKNTSQPTTTPKAGDVIGSITITITTA